MTNEYAALKINGPFPPTSEPFLINLDVVLITNYLRNTLQAFVSHKNVPTYANSKSGLISGVLERPV